MGINPPKVSTGGKPRPGDPQRTPGRSFPATLELVKASARLDFLVRVQGGGRSVDGPVTEEDEGKEKNVTQDVNTTSEDEFYDDATESFPSVEDLVPLANSKNPDSVGRLVAIWAISNGQAKGENGMYGYTETVTLVLDDGPEGDQATDLVGVAPQKLNLRHSTMGIHSRLAPRVEGTNKAGVPLRFRPMIGRVNTKASTKYKKGSPAVSISAPTEADQEIIQQHKALIISINKEMESKATKAEDEAAFE